ncbi:hypothetical protein [Aeromicrobium endophyticum]|uniref:HK97 gp10 family phage protein n=1 Tax=Aeromicrobium endophyticum TaxID=2292704 RepID=A0A371PDC9_9ACTN|nr:hypothetical protein [Aeromicrobium endophyticum]REK73646.1 hypothetical protein DX116_08960 [Aeromicrobium endophyticum]
MSSFELDTSEIRALAADMRPVPDVLAKEVRAVVVKGAVNIKNDQRRAANESRHFDFARAISFDLHGGSLFGTAVIEAEIGPVKGKPGSLANIAYFGTSRGGGTVEDPGSALERESAKYHGALENLMGNLL